MTSNTPLLRQSFLPTDETSLDFTVDTKLQSYERLRFNCPHFEVYRGFDQSGKYYTVFYRSKFCIHRRRVAENCEVLPSGIPLCKCCSSSYRLFLYTEGEVQSEGSFVEFNHTSEEGSFHEQVVLYDT